MVYRINSYSLSFRALDSLTQTSSRLEKSLEKLSSGLRINSAADDPTGLGVAERLRMQARGLYQARMNSQNGVSMLQAADTAMESTHAILQTMRERAQEALDGTLTAEDRLQLQSEINRLRDDLNEIAWNTEFNTLKLLDGSRNGVVTSSSPGVKGILTGIPEASGQYLVSIALVSPGTSQIQQTQTFTNKSTGALAQGTTTLQSIAQFYDGANFLLDIPATVTVSRNGETSSFTIDGSTTLGTLASSFQAALRRDSGPDIAGSTALYVGTAMTGLANVGGYVELVSGQLGTAGEFSVVADTSVLQALGLTTTRNAKGSTVNLTLQDLFGNMSTVQTSSDRAVGLLDGVDVQFASQAAQIAGTRGLSTGLNMAATALTISAGGTTLNVNIAAGNWTLEGLARRINSQTTAVTTLSTSVVDGELRMTYTGGPDFKITAATANNNLGITVGTYSGYLETVHNTAAETLGFSRYYASTTTGVLAGSTAVFTITDGAGATVAITAFNTIGSAAIATPDMQTFAAFQATANAVLTIASVQVQVDQVGMSFAFTSKLVGTYTPSSGASVPSYLAANVAGTDAALQAPLQYQFGLYAGNDYGTGDKNFSLFVVKTNSAFQLGSNAGQALSLDIGTMSAEALGLGTLDVTSTAGAERAMARIDQAIDRVSAERGKVGALQNRLTSAITSLTEQRTNALDAEARIRDVDMAAEIIEFTRNSVFLESGTAVLAQANLFPGNVMRLLDND
ncbi:MAG: hypothetical protein GX442_25025 [Candidatus Riflebacteria bacterium]|nr:hypothetical protein [Candidatus Riflebacteria bacterium]